jgi:uncharacterized protein YwgA
LFVRTEIKLGVSVFKQSKNIINKYIFSMYEDKKNKMLKKVYIKKKNTTLPEHLQNQIQFF